MPSKKSGDPKKKADTGKKTDPAPAAAKPRARKARKARKAKKSAAVPRAPSKPAVAESSGFPIVGIGASAGGLEAFETFFKAMPADSGVAFVLVAHLDPTHVSILPELLQKRTKMKVCQIRNGMLVRPDTVYVIPPNKDLSILNGVLHLMDLVQPRGANLPIDTLFRSLAQDQGANAVCVILSGTGTDGTLGLKAIKGEVGMVMVQNEESAKYDGMPRSAIATGLADYILPPEAMPEQLIKYTKHARGKVAPRIVPAQGEPDALQKIFIILRARTDHDFSLYKKNTICRRIERRMNVHQIGDISDYVRYLQESQREVGILFKELLIGVTNFFRDPEAFEALKRKALLKCLRGKADDYTLRAWVPGCSSGEEAYSVAIALHECMDAVKRRFSVQVFGTDIDEDAIAVARAGLYPASILADLGAERLKRYFVLEDDGQYRIKKAIREMLVFAPQNMIKDPPFTKLDLLSCRNLLIYLAPELQKKLLPLFHHARGAEGILVVRSAETVGQAGTLFAPLDSKWKIFRRKPAPATHVLLDLPTAPAVAAVPASPVADTIKRAEEISAFQLVETILRQSDTPPCAIVDDTANVVYIHGRTGRFLEPAEGKVSVNVIEMARPGLKSALATAVRKVGLNKQEMVSRGLRVQYNGEELTMDLIVRPVLEHPAMRGLIMVVFQETATPEKAARGRIRPAPAKRRGKTVRELEEELSYNRESLQTTIEELETSNEELKSTNEELQSTNEELQSTNEEMETSKEELQSLNEEASTVNAELQSRIEDLSKANDDMKNLLDSTEIATIFLDTELCIGRFTPKATEIIPLAGTDSGRPIRHFASKLVNVDLTAWAEKVLDDLAVKKSEVRHADGRIFLMRVRPYRTAGNVIDGVVITFDDITQFKQVEASLIESERNMRLILESSPDYVFVVDRAGTIQYLNRAPEGLQVSEVIGTSFYDYQPSDKGQHRLIRETLEQVFQTGEASRLETRGASHGHAFAAYETYIRPIMEEQQVVAAIVKSTKLSAREKPVSGQ